MAFDIPLAFHIVLSLYYNQMDSYGWRLIKDFVAEEHAILFFDLPEKICVVDIQDRNDLTYLTLFLRKK